MAFQRNDTPTSKKDEPFGGNDWKTKTGTLTLRGALLLCDRRMAYATVGRFRTLNVQSDLAGQTVAMHDAPLLLW